MTHTFDDVVHPYIGVMRQWWYEFDRIHAVQPSRRPPPRGLLDDTGRFAQLDHLAPPVYRQLLPTDLDEEITTLWHGMALPRWPDRIVSAFHPHRLMSEAFGPAAGFWHGVAMTCWSACETYTNKSLNAVARYFEADVTALAVLGCPVDPALFEDLKCADQRLGPPKPWDEGWDRRRDGYETVRDVVTEHRRSWARQHLEAYLRRRPRHELLYVTNTFDRWTAERNRPPTIKQFATVSVPFANHWFGGDLAAAYLAMDQPAPGRPTRRHILTADPHYFTIAVYRSLLDIPSNKPVQLSDAQWRAEHSASRLTDAAPRFVQEYEARDRAPTFHEFGAERFDWQPFGGPDDGWRQYQQIVTAACTQAPTTP